MTLIFNCTDSYIPLKYWWLCFYDKNANRTFMVPGNFGDLKPSYTQNISMLKYCANSQEAERYLNDTYTYRFFGRGTDDVDSFVNPDIMDFPEGTVLTSPDDLLPVPTATASPAPQNTATPLPAHTATTSPVPTHTATATPIPKDTATPTQFPTPVPAKAFIGKSLRVKQDTSYQFSCKLRWKKSPAADAYAIYRSSIKKRNYRMLAKDWKKTYYVDKRIKAGMTYYYQVIPYKKGQALESCLSAAMKQQKKKSKKITVSELKPPSASFSKRKTAAGQHYIEIKLKKYEGNVLQIYTKKNHSYQKLSLKNPNLQKRNQKFRILYQQGGTTLYFKLRTYQKTAGKRKYSLYSKEYKLRI